MPFFNKSRGSAVISATLTFSRGGSSKKVTRQITAAFVLVLMINVTLNAD